MTSNKQRTWWQEMGAISRGMMFLDGSFVTPAAVEAERRMREVLPVAADQSPPAAATPFSIQDKVRWLLEDLVLLGGRPVTLPHNDDINEPLPLLHRRHRHPVARERRTADTATTCATC